MEWHTLTLSDIATVKSGSGFPKKYQGLPNESYPFYKVSDMNLTGNEESLYFENNTISSQIRGVLKATLFPVGSIVFPKVGAAIATNKKRILTKVGCVDNNVMGVIPKKDKIDSRFLYFWFQQHNLSEFANEAALPSIKKTTVEEWPVKLPICKIEQKRIVAILDQAFADLEQTRAKTEQNLKNARELFDSYLERVFSQKGEGWVEYELKQVAYLKSGNTVKKELEQEQGDIAYVKVSGMNLEGNENEITTSNMYLDKASIKSSNILPVGTTIFPKRGGAIATNKKRITAIPLCIDLNTMGVIPKQEIVLPHYIYFYFKTFDLIAISNGTTIPQINNYSFDGLKLTLPNLSGQEKEIKKMRNIEEAVERLTQLYKIKLNYLEVLKKSILQKAFSGELNAKA